MIYLNNAATGFPKPQIVLDTVTQIISRAPFSYGRSGLERGDKNILNDTRQAISNFLNVSEEYHIVLTSGSTEALNLAIFGLELSDCEVIISATDHNSVIRPLYQLKKEKNITIKVAPCDENGLVNPDEISALINDKTQLICINHCSNVTGTYQDIKAVSKIADKNNIKLMVDGSQAAGLINVDISDYKPDFYTFTGHKSLNGLQGTGGLIFKKSIDLRPLKFGGTGTFSHLLEQPNDFPAKYESGTMNIVGFAALEAGIKWITEIGLDNIRAHKKLLTERIKSELSNLNGINFYYDEHNSSGSILSLTLNELDIDEINYILANSFDISIRSGLHCAPLIHKYLSTEPKGTLRISPSYFTTDSEIEKFIYDFRKIVISLS